LLTLVPVTAWSLDKTSEQRELQLNRVKWTLRGITSYEIRLHEECFCPPPWSGPFRVSVRGGKVINVVYDGQSADGYWPGRVVSKKHRTDLTLTIEDVFVRAEKAINLTDQRHKIQYDPEYGFPKLIDVDNPHRMADAQWKVVVDDFHPNKR